MRARSYVGHGIIIVLLAHAAGSCGRDKCATPFGEGGSIVVTEYSELDAVGGSVALNRGHRGIMVTRTTYSDFVAFEMSCPNDHDVRLETDAEWGNSIMVCPTCGSRFNALDGTPLSGSATPCPLYQYSTTFDGRTLTIY